MHEQMHTSDQSPQVISVATSSPLLSQEQTHELAEILVQQPAFQPTALDLAARRTPAPLIIPEDQREGALTTIAASLCRLGASDDVLKIALNAFNTIQCRPPLPKEGMQRLLRRAAGWRRDSPPAKHYEQPTVLPRVQDVKSLLTTKLPEPAWVVPDLLPEGVSLLMGRPRVGKSWLALELAMAVAVGTTVLGRIPVQLGEVLFLALEDGAWCIAGRSRKLLHGRAAPNNLKWAGTWSRLDKGGLADLEDWLDEHPMTRLIVIDALEQLMPPQKGRGRQRSLLLPFKMLCERYHLAILCICSETTDITHVGIPERGWDTHLALSRDATGPQANLLITSAYSEEYELALAFHPDRGLWIVTS